MAGKRAKILSQENIERAYEKGHEKCERMLLDLWDKCISRMKDDVLPAAARRRVGDRIADETDLPNEIMQVLRGAGGNHATRIAENLLPGSANAKVREVVVGYLLKNHFNENRKTGGLVQELRNLADFKGAKVKGDSINLRICDVLGFNFDKVDFSGTKVVDSFAYTRAVGSKIDIGNLENDQNEYFYISASDLNSSEIFLGKGKSIQSEPFRIIGTSFEGCRIEGLNIKVEIEKGRFDNARINNSGFTGKMKSTNFRCIKVENLKFSECLIEDVDFRGSQINNMRITDCRIEDLGLDGIKASGLAIEYREQDSRDAVTSDLVNFSLKNSMARETTFRGLAIGSKTSMNFSDLQGSFFDEIDFSDSRKDLLMGADLTGCSFIQCSGLSPLQLAVSRVSADLNIGTAGGGNWRDQDLLAPPQMEVDATDRITYADVMNARQYLAGLDPAASLPRGITPAMVIMARDLIAEPDIAPQIKRHSEAGLREMEAGMEDRATSWGEGLKDRYGIENVERKLPRGR